MVNISEVDHSRKGGKFYVNLQKELIVKVFVQNKAGQPLMPTSPRKARLLLTDGQARIVQRNPFTIQLLYATSGYKQPVTLGIDAGYQTIGYSAITDKEELVGGEMEMLKGMSERMTERAMYRRTRRSRKRYRKPRFDNRRKETDWLAPSVQHKLDTHHRLIERIKKVLPVTRTIIEVANFDIQKIKNPTIAGEAYQQGEQSGFWNLREYILHRDGHKCQNPDCNNRSKEMVLCVHHLGYWKKDRTDRPSNLITLCTRCHTSKNHQKSGFLYEWFPNLKSFKPETFMSTVRWRMVNQSGAEHTYGWQTKSVRIALDIPKSHHNDAFVIAGGITQPRVEALNMEQIRRNNRSLQKFYDAKYIDLRTGEKASGKELHSGRTKRNKNLNGENLRVYRGRKLSKGRRSIRRKRYHYQPNDLVMFDGQTYRNRGMSSYGRYLLLDGLKKNVKVGLVSPVRWRKGLCAII